MITGTIKCGFGITAEKYVIVQIQNKTHCVSVPDLHRLNCIKHQVQEMWKKLLAFCVPCVIDWHGVPPGYYACLRKWKGMYSGVFVCMGGFFLAGFICWNSSGWFVFVFIVSISNSFAHSFLISQPIPTMNAACFTQLLQISITTYPSLRLLIFFELYLKMINVHKNITRYCYTCTSYF